MRFAVAFMLTCPLAGTVAGVLILAEAPLGGPVTVIATPWTGSW
jgi:hypothetical protein